MFKYIFLSLIVIIVISFFGYDLQQIIEAPTTHNNLSYVWGGVTYVWNHFLERPLAYLWNKVFVGILWQAFVHNLGRIDSGAPTELQDAGQRMIETGERGYQPLGQ